MDDYYAIVGVDRNASHQEIDRAIQNQLRLWQRRASSADLARRHEAERRVQQLSRARAVLLDEQQRLRYDGRLDVRRAAAPPAPPPAPPPPVPNPMPLPLPGPPPAPVSGKVPKPYLEFRYSLAAQALAVATVGCVVLLGLAAMLAGVDYLSPILALLFSTGISIALVLRGKSPALVLGPWVVTVTGKAPQHVPWERVQAIQTTEVDGVQRVEIVTVDGVHVLTPAPRGRRMLGRGRRFDRRLAAMQRFHSRRSGR